MLRQTGKLVEEKFVVEYKKELYDITEFMHKHPGGVNTLNGYNRKNIEDKFLSVEHSTAAEYLLKDYKLKHQSEDNNNNFDDSMEHLIDWSAALLPQISRLGGEYSEWVNKPVDRKMRLFQHPLLEMLTKTPWYLPPVFWIPIIVFLIVNEATTSVNCSILTIFFHLTTRIFVWTLLEYTLHRYLFHMNVENNPKWSTFHFMLHGLHHKVPFDEFRLVFPPVPAAILAAIIYQPIHVLNSIGGNELYFPRLLLAGGLVGYLVYDMIHYYIHYGSPATKYFYHLKRYHYNHHFVQHDKGYGISSPIWDEIFGTKILLKKLKYMLKW